MPFQLATFMDQEDFPRAANMPEVAKGFCQALIDFRIAHHIYHLIDLPSFSDYAESMAKHCYENGRDAVVPLSNDIRIVTLCFDITGNIESGDEILQGVLADSHYTDESEAIRQGIEDTLLRGGNETFCGVGVYGNKHDKVLFVALDLRGEQSGFKGGSKHGRLPVSLS